MRIERFRLRFLLLALASLWVAQATAAAPMVAIPGDPVATASGMVAGTRLSSGVRAYLGIPYAKPPTQDLRWRPPQPIHWEGVWNADRKGPECIQVLRPHNINHYFGEEATSEDCLTLNIWTPEGAVAGKHLPVIVFIYGGGGTIGSAGMANYDGEHIARRGAIFVNLNYRVGLLGFMAHPELTAEQGGHSGNYGYLDQRAALQWIHDNIAAFGGDPGKVVITGQSFGAGSVAAQMTSPLSKGLFRAGVMMSACSLTTPAAPLAAGEAAGLELQRRLGAANLAAMRNVPADRILAVQSETQVGVNVQGVRAPAIIDGYFWTSQKEAALASGAVNAIPIIASSNSDDLDANQSPLTKAHTVAEYKAAAVRLYGPDADAFLKLFPVAGDADVQPMAHAAAREAGMLQSSRACGQLMAKAAKAPTYVDLFVQRHPYAPGLTLADQDVATVGAYHTADVPYWFDTLGNYNLIRTTRSPGPADARLTDQMTGALIALAETGSPSTPAMPWPAWSAASAQYLVLGAPVATATMNQARMDWLAAHPIASEPPPPRANPRD